MTPLATTQRGPEHLILVGQECWGQTGHHENESPWKRQGSEVDINNHSSQLLHPLTCKQEGNELIKGPLLFQSPPLFTLNEAFMQSR